MPSHFLVAADPGTAIVVNCLTNAVWPPPARHHGLSSPLCKSWCAGRMPFSGWRGAARTALLEDR